MTDNQGNCEHDARSSQVSVPFVIGVISSLIIVVVAFGILSYFVNLIERAGVPWSPIAYLSPLLLLIGIPLFNRYLFPKKAWDAPEIVQFFILLITILSFYAFGWPKEVE